MTVQPSNVRELTSQVLALSADDRRYLMELIARSLQADIAPADETNGTTESGQSPTAASEPHAEGTQNLDENGDDDSLLVWLASLEPLDEDFPEIYDPPVTVGDDIDL